MGLLTCSNTKDNFAIQRLTFMHLWTAIWKLCVICKTWSLLAAHAFVKPEHGDVRTLFHSWSCVWRPSTDQELQVLMCTIVTSTVSWFRNHSFYSLLPLIAWVMLFLTFLSEGVFRTQWAFCLTPSDAFSRQTGTSLCQWIRSPATSQLPQWVLCLPAFLSAHRRLQQQHLKACAFSQRW